MNREALPRLPVFGWQAFAGERDADTPCLLSLPQLHYSTSGRAAILLALESLGVGPGDGVLLPTYHCPTMVAPAADRGATVHFYPIDDHGRPNLIWLEQQDLRGVRALLAAHFFGLPQPMARLRAWCQSRGIALIEDCAHALFGRSGERPIGAWGDVAIASLTKFLPVPEGGCLIINNGGAAPALRPCDTTNQIQAAVDILEVGAVQGRLTGFNTVIAGGLNLLRLLRGGGPATAVRNDAPGTHGAHGAHSALLSSTELSIDSALAHRQLSRASRWVGRSLPRQRIVQRRRHNYQFLTRSLSGHTGLRPLLPELPADCAPYVFPLWVAIPDPGYAQLRAKHWPVFRWDRLWPGVPPIEGDHGLNWSHHVLQLACHQDLVDSDLESFAQSLLRLYQQRS